VIRDVTVVALVLTWSATVLVGFLIRRAVTGPRTADEVPSAAELGLLADVRSAAGPPPGRRWLQGAVEDMHDCGVAERVPTADGGTRVVVVAPLPPTGPPWWRVVAANSWPAVVPGPVTRGRLPDGSAGVSAPAHDELAAEAVRHGLLLSPAAHGRITVLALSLRLVMTVEFVLFLVLRPDSERVGPGLDAALIWLAVAVVAVGPLAVTGIAPRGVTARGRRWLRVARRWEGDHPPSADCALSRLEAGGARELLTDLDARLGVMGWSAEDLRSGHRDPHRVLPAACVRLREGLTAAQIQRLVATLGEDEFVTLVRALGADRVAAALADAPAIVSSASTWDLPHVVRRLGYPAARRGWGPGSSAVASCS
jgi:hypothetical protein